MPPKVNEDVLKVIEAFEKLGLPKAKAQEVVRTPKQANALSQLFSVVDSSSLSDITGKQALLLLQLASGNSDLSAESSKLICESISKEELSTTEQVSAAIKYCAGNADFDRKSYESATGIGYTISSAEVSQHVQNYVLANKAEMETSRWSGIGRALGGLKQVPELQWAPALEVKAALEEVFLETFGPKEDKAAIKARLKKEQAKDKPAPTAAAASSSATQTEADTLSETKMFEEGWLARLHKPGENPQKLEERMKEHLKATNGQVYTRFPPEPNGYMHIGHLKALVINFGYAKYHGGHCYLRYDDTNPEAEKQEYIDAILETIHWLGFDPFKITFASDYFQQLFDCARDLIKRGLAYVDHSTGLFLHTRELARLDMLTAEEMKIQRGGEERGPRVPSKYRDRPIQESLAEFDAMKEGKYQPGEAVLRMKQDLEDGNPQMWDLVAYRVLNTPHHRTGTTWKIYPTYDFTHCLNDSFENISHSLCTVEFILSRQSYEWLCDALDLYRPKQSEYGRLNIQGTITSKRKLKKLVDDKHVKDWDDPRIYTLAALKRRGVPPAALRTFISQLGVTTAQTALPLARLEQTIRQYLEMTTPRLMLVLDPVKVTIENLPEDYVTMIERPVHPKNPSLGTTAVPYTRTVYIDRSDFREVDSPDYFRMAPGKTVGLLYTEFPVTCTSCRKDESGQVVEIFCKVLDEGKPVKPKAFIQWVAEHKPSGSPIMVDEARLFNPLFTSENPAASPTWVDEINPNSLQVAKGAMVEVGLWDVASAALKEARLEFEQRQKAAKVETAAKSPTVQSKELIGYECVRFQGLRVAYFCLDKETQIKAVDEKRDKISYTQGDRIVLNTIVSLKEDKDKKI